MQTGTIVLVVVAILAVLAGFAGFAISWWTKIRVAWKVLDPANGSRYFAQDKDFSAEDLRRAVNFAVGCLAKGKRWSEPEVMNACRDFCVYVFAHDLYAGKPGIAGYEEGGIIGVNRKLTTLCHELGHLCEERLAKDIDITHSRFEADGIDKAEGFYLAWLRDL